MKGFAGIIHRHSSDAGRLNFLSGQIAAVKIEVDKVRTAKKSTSEVHITVGASSAVTAPVSIENRVAAAGRTWPY